MDEMHDTTYPGQWFDYWHCFDQRAGHASAAAAKAGKNGIGNMMAIKELVNIFRIKDLLEPEDIFNWHLWFAVVSFGLMGAAGGVDEGLISGAFNSKEFQAYINYKSYSEVEQANIKENVSEMVRVGSVGEALFAFLVCDRIGRIWATRLLCLVWILGIAISLGDGGSLAAVYAGRFVAGLGVGATVVVGPIYLSEIAPASIHGLCTCVFGGFVFLGIALAHFANYGCEVNLGNETHRRRHTVVPTSLHIMFAGVIFLLSFLQYESPRYLIKRGQIDKAISRSSAIFIASIQRAHEVEMDATVGTGPIGWTGAGSITVYATDLFHLLGTTGNHSNLLVTVAFGIVKLIAAIICALFLVDVIGRKRFLLLGIALQAISMVYVAGFLTAVPEMGVKDGFKLPTSKEGAGKGDIAMIHVSGLGWALGWNSMRYLLTAELFPLRVRALATSMAMTLHFANPYSSSRAVSSMLLPVENGCIGPIGKFWCFGAVTIVGDIWVWFSVPETAGRSLESMDSLFALP
ncbi:major facilitator superfamily domain-containing protein [Aspergillus tetrazonus]